MPGNGGVDVLLGGDADLLAEVLHLNPDLEQVALWGKLMRQSGTAYPLNNLSDLDPLLALSAAQGITVQDPFLQQHVPANAFPVSSEADFLSKVLRVIQGVHSGLGPPMGHLKLTRVLRLPPNPLS